MFGDHQNWFQYITPQFQKQIHHRRTSAVRPVLFRDFKAGIKTVLQAHKNLPIIAQ
jgi:hypothetical protein